jgi:uncharacterized membrane protein
MKRQGKLIAGVVVGAGAMYLLGPDRGARRRSLLRERGVDAGQKLRDRLAATARDSTDRVPGDEVLHEWMRPRKNWAPATRLLVGSAGGIMALKGSRTRGVAGKAMRAVGLGLLARAASNIPPRHLGGLGAGRRANEIEKTLLVMAPVDQVWELWSNFENFPRFMAHLREVSKIDEGRSRWVAVGPAGVSVEWEAEVTDWVPEQFIGWTSVEGSSIETTGQVRFRPISSSETEIDVQLSYNPPAGAAGHAIAALMGTDPKRAMDEDLGRFKSLLEEGKTGSKSELVHSGEGAGKSKSTRPGKGSSPRKRKS